LGIPISARNCVVCSPSSALCVRERAAPDRPLARRLADADRGLAACCDRTAVGLADDISVSGPGSSPPGTYRAENTRIVAARAPAAAGNNCGRA
jgi:hypothetical protein